jgi:hypothetical protein
MSSRALPGSGDAVPKVVRRFAQDAADGVGAEPVVERLSPRSWRVAFDGEHVVAEAFFEARPGGALKHVRGALRIDGEDRPLQDLDELRVTWDTYEQSAVTPPGDTAEEQCLAAVPGLARGRPVPSEVRQVRDTLAASIGDDEVRAGYADGRWIVGFDVPGGDGLRMFFTRTAHGRWVPDGQQPVQLVAGGQDVTAEAGLDMASALARLAQAHPDISDGGPAPGKPQRGARDQGVETRRMVVLRQLADPGGGSSCQPLPGGSGSW